MDDKEKRWKQKRIGKITSSCLSKINTGGRGKSGGKYGDTCFCYLYEVMYERVTGEEASGLDNANFRIGRENEPYAVQWLRDNIASLDLNLPPEYAMGLIEIEHCSVDLPEIVFDEPFGGVKFGDSPDIKLRKQDGACVAVGEIKCLVSKGKFQKYKMSTPADLIDEHKEQMCGHFMANPGVDKLLYLVYDAIIEDVETSRDISDPSRGIVIIYDRSDFGDLIDELEARIREADAAVDEAIRLGVKIETVLNQ